MLGFDRPALLLLIFLVPLFFVLRKLRLFRQTEFPLTLGDWNGLPFRWSSPVMLACAVISRVAMTAAFVAGCVALAGPVLYRQEQVFAGKGPSVIFAVDISPSMAARDIGNDSRIDVARHYIHDFVAERPGDSFGLVALASDAALLVPPTPDHKVFLSRLDSLAIGELGDGTAIGMGLAVAAAHLVNRHGSHACVILLTDGENNTGEINPKTAAGIFPENGIRLFIVGIGTKGEVPIEYTDPSTGKRYSGMLQSEYNEGALREIASRADGMYVSAANRSGLETVFRQIGDSVPASRSSWTRSIEEPLETPFIGAALALFALAWFVRRLVMGAVL
jgi:Ca-activated chloride channel family protein